VRRHVHLPIIFTVRSAGQGGRYPDDDEAGLFARTRCPSTCITHTHTQAKHVCV
jgi:hypothetical protein